MSEHYISSVHIEKLGHQIEEIRIRALENIISKLNHGFIYDNDLARSKEILFKLFQWFTFEPVNNELDVLKLIKRILETDSGTTLAKHYGVNKLITELKKIKSVIQLRNYSLIDSIIDHVNSTVQQENENEKIGQVPPLISNVPLSYRSEDGSVYQETDHNIGNIATPITGIVFQEGTSSLNGDAHNPIINNGSIDENEELESNKNKANDHCKEPLIFIGWIPLVNSDRHVLSSVEESLQNPSDPSVLLHTCDFFKDVMLQDFPPEVFLQRPVIVSRFLVYIKKTTSSRFQIAILNCFYKLISNMITRIELLSDPNTFTLKHTEALEIGKFVPDPDKYSSYTASIITDSTSDNECVIEDNVNSVNQFKVPDFCCDVLTSCFELTRKFSVELEEKVNKTNNYAKIYKTFFVINKSIDLLNMCISPEVWYQKHVKNVEDVLFKLNDALVKYGEALEYLRVAVVTNEEDKILRVMYLHLLCNCIKMLNNVMPDNEVELILPNSLKTALVNSLSDAMLAQLYPKVHSAVLLYVQKFQDSFKSTSVRKYKEASSIYRSVTASIKFLKHYKDLSMPLAIDLADEGVSCLDLHRNMNFIKKFVFMCSQKNRINEEELMTKAQGIILKLLAYNDVNIQEEIYKACHKIVVKCVGPIFTTSSEHFQIVFLLNCDIFAEISIYGMNHNNKEIQKYAEEILIYLLKSKMLVSEEIWNKIIEIFIGTLPVFICHVCKRSPLGRTVLGMLDPDTAQTLNISKVIVLKTNIGILFTRDSLMREEVISRLLWMLSSQTNSINLLPRLSSLTGRNINAICQFQPRFDINRCFSSRQYYQNANIVQILDILKSNVAEPVIKRSALTQISVMLEEPLLQIKFLDHEGLKLVLEIMGKALNEKDLETYPDCVVPAITILKNLCMYSSRARQELKSNIDAYFCILRGLFSFNSEEKVRVDAGTLLFFLIFGDYVLGNPKSYDISIPHFFFEKLSIPFECNKHWKSSSHSIEALAPVFFGDKWNLNSLKIYWNAEWYGGIHNILKWEELPYNRSNSLEFNSVLMLTETDLKILKNSSLYFCLKEYLGAIQVDSTHKTIINDINLLICCLTPFVTSYDLLDFDYIEFSILPWEGTLGHFLNIPPANGGDIFLLTALFKCLQVLIPLYKGSAHCWIVSILKDECHCLPNILKDNVQDDTHGKILHQELLNLITVCVCQENRSILKEKQKSDEEAQKNWNYVIKIITESLKAGQTQYFYNLAFLDCQLSCLVHLTGSVEWGRSKEYPKEFLASLVRVILDLVTAFHEGKGQTAALSLMGIGIIRHSVLILNHLLVELQSQNIKGWETYYIGESFDDESNCLKKIFSLRDCRDVVLRAAALQILAGLSMMPRAAAELNKELWMANNYGLWQSTLGILLNHDEATIVRESAGNLLSNLAGHIATNNTKDALVTIYLTQTKIKKEINCSSAVFLLVEEFKLFKEIQEFLTYILEENLREKRRCCAGVFLYVRANSKKSLSQIKNISSESGSSSSSSASLNKDDMQSVPKSPGFVRYLASLVQNLLVLDPDIVVSQLQQFELLPLFFRCICNPTMEINSTKDLVYYCELVEMNISICSLLTKAVESNSNCIYSLINSRDCLHFLLGLLNTAIYYTYLPHLLFLRNQMWKEIFTLIRTVLNTALENKEKNENAAIISENIHNIISSLLIEGENKEFLETVSEAILSDHSVDLQNSALTSLTSLLQVDVLTPVSSSVSWGCLLDSVKTSRTQIIETELVVHDLENIEPLNSAKSNNKKSTVELLWSKNKRPKRPDKEKHNLLQNLYFRNIPDEVGSTTSSFSDDGKVSVLEKCETTVAGSELCRILVYLYRVSSIDNKNIVRKMNTIHSLTNLLCVSQEAKKQAVEDSFLQIVIFHLKELHIKLSLESVDYLRTTAKKKKTLPALKEVEALIGLLTNFMYGCENVKILASNLALADLTHKFWLWFTIQKRLLLAGLKMLCTFTADCETACCTLPFTSSAAGSGPRKSQSNTSLLNEVLTLITREMEQISRTHDLHVLELCLHLLQNCCISSECRQTINKSNIYQSISRLHPSLTKGQRPWDRVELLWMRFLQTYTTYYEGQTSLTKSQDAFTTILTLAHGTRSPYSHEALLVLQNIAFHSLNRPKLLNSGEFLNVLQDKLSNGSMEDKTVTTTILWALSANNQRAKLVFKCSGLNLLLKDSINRISFTSDANVDVESLKKMKYVYDILKDD